MIVLAAAYAELAAHVHELGRLTFAIVLAGVALVFLLWPVPRDKQ